jgi:hypothetical protein
MQLKSRFALWMSALPTTVSAAHFAIEAPQADALTIIALTDIDVLAGVSRTTCRSRGASG